MVVGDSKDGMWRNVCRQNCLNKTGWKRKYNKTLFCLFGESPVFNALWQVAGKDLAERRKQDAVIVFYTVRRLFVGGDWVCCDKYVEAVVEGCFTV